MSRLIDADKLIEHFRNCWNRERMVDSDGVIMAIEEFPTAYDVDKILNKLEDWVQIYKKTAHELGKENDKLKEENRKLYNQLMETEKDAQEHIATLREALESQI